MRRAAVMRLRAADAAWRLFSADMCFWLLSDVGDLHHADVRAYGLELAYQVLIAPLDELHLAQFRGALGTEPGNDHGRACPQVTSLDRGALEMVYALNDGHVAVIEGVDHLQGAPVQACDLRAGAAMVIAGLSAQGTTELSQVQFIERGYEDLVGKLKAVGADIRVVEVPDVAEQPEAHIG